MDTSYVVTQWISEIKNLILSYSANSANMNPIENLWISVAKKIYTNIRPQNTEALWQTNETVTAEYRQGLIYLLTRPFLCRP